MVETDTENSIWTIFKTETTQERILDVEIESPANLRIELVCFCWIVRSIFASIFPQTDQQTLLPLEASTGALKKKL